MAGATQQARYASIDLELSWSEAELPRVERTKHVHGLHPYLGNFVPQLVEANVLGADAVGCDISAPAARPHSAVTWARWLRCSQTPSAAALRASNGVTHALTGCAGRVRGQDAGSARIRGYATPGPPRSTKHLMG